MNYFVISMTDWRISARDFAQHLLARWPGATLRGVVEPESSHRIEFELSAAHSELSGSLNREGKAVSFVGDLRDVAEFALWFRSLAPASERIFFCDDSMSGSLDLEPGTTPEDIFQPYDYTPPPEGWMNYSFQALPDWPLSAREFARLLRARWASARIEESTSLQSARSVEFRLPMAHSQVEGSLKREGGVLSFTGDIRDCAELALWSCSVVPAEKHLLSSERGFLYLEPRTTVQAILDALESRPRSITEV